MFEINKYKLDAACLEQVEMMEETTYLLAEAKQVIETLKQNLTLAKSTVSSEGRKNPAAYDIDKVTEKQVDAAVELSPVVSNAQLKLSEAKDKLTVLEGKLETLKHRKSMVESLIYLHGAGYFSSVRPVEDSPEPNAEKSGDNDSSIPTRRIRK